MLDDFKNLGPNTELTLKLLTLKFVVLLGLLSGQRYQILHCLNIKDMHGFGRIEMCLPFEDNAVISLFDYWRLGHLTPERLFLKRSLNDSFWIVLTFLNLQCNSALYSCYHLS